jgi:hypothetical protein
MINNEHDNVLAQRITLRLSSHMYTVLCKKAKQQEQSLSTYVRGYLTQWLQSPNNDKASQANIQAMSEILYLVRAIANVCEPKSLIKARAQARSTVEKIYHTQEEATSCD